MSSGFAFVMMMQTADFGYLDYFTVGERLYASCFRDILLQRQMSPPVMVIAAVSRERATQRALTEHHDVVQTFAADRADEPLYIHTHAATGFEALTAPV
jgi:hypothetical protein